MSSENNEAGAAGVDPSALPRAPESNQGAPQRARDAPSMGVGGQVSGGKVADLSIE